MSFYSGQMFSSSFVDDWWLTGDHRPCLRYLGSWEVLTVHLHTARQKYAVFSHICPIASCFWRATFTIQLTWKLFAWIIERTWNLSGEDWPSPQDSISVDKKIPVEVLHLTEFLFDKIYRLATWSFKVNGHVWTCLYVVQVIYQWWRQVYN